MMVDRGLVHVAKAVKETNQGNQAAKKTENWTQRHQDQCPLNNGEEEEGRRQSGFISLDRGKCQKLWWVKFLCQIDYSFKNSNK